MADLTQDEAWAAGATRVPEEIVGDVYEVTNDGRPTGWPKFYDRTVEVWEETGERYDDDVVMTPGSGWVPMLRRDVQAFWGPLVAEEAYDEFASAVNRRQALDYAASQEMPTEETMMTTHPTTPPSTDRPPADPRLALLCALHAPPYDLAAGKTSTPLGEAVRLIDAYRAAVLHEVADRYQDYIDKADTSADPRYWTAIRDMTLGLRRVAAEKAGPAELLNATEAAEARTPCGPVPDECDPDGEPCDRHETERAHAEGEHAFCGVTCEVEFPTELLRNSILAKGYPGTAGMLDELLRRAAAGLLSATETTDV